jgi:hypothetical protein
MAAFDPADLVIAALNACCEVFDAALDGLPLDGRMSNQMRVIMALTLLAKVCVESGLSPETAGAMAADLLPGKMRAIEVDTAEAFHEGGVPS